MYRTNILVRGFQSYFESEHKLFSPSIAHKSQGGVKNIFNLQVSKYSKKRQPKADRSLNEKTAQKAACLNLIRRLAEAIW